MILMKILYALRAVVSSVEVMIVSGTSTSRSIRNMNCSFVLLLGGSEENSKPWKQQVVL